MSSEPLITLFDITTTKGAFSPFAWRARLFSFLFFSFFTQPDTIYSNRLALNYKKVNYKTHWLALTDIKPNHLKLGIPQTVHPVEKPFYTVPAIVDASSSPPTTISQSYNIEKYLDEKFPDPPLYSVIPPGSTNSVEVTERVAFLRELDEFLQTKDWRRKILGPLVIPHVPSILQERDRSYFYESRSRWFQVPFDDIYPKGEAKEAYLRDLKAAFDEVESISQKGRPGPYVPNDPNDAPWVCGNIITGGDFTLIGVFIWIQKANPELWDLIKTWNSGRWLRMFELSAEWRANEF